MQDIYSAPSNQKAGDDVMNLTDYLYYLYAEQTLPPIEDTPEEVTVVDGTVDRAIQDILYYCKKHSIQTDLFDALLVKPYNKMRNTGKTKSLVEEDIQKLFNLISSNDYLNLYNTVNAIQLLHNHGIEVKLYHKQMQMFYRRFCKICYKKFKEDRKKHFVQLVRHKLETKQITEEEVRGATVGYFYDISKPLNGFTLMSMNVKDIQSLLNSNFRKVCNTSLKKQLKCAEIYKEIEQMKQCLFRFLYKQEGNPHYLYSTISNILHRYVYNFDIHMITKDNRIICLNYDTIDVYNQHAKLVHSIPSSVSVRDVISYHPLVFLACNTFDEYFPPVTFNQKNSGTDIIERDNDSNVNDRKVANWRIHQKHLDECRTIVYDGDLIKLFSEIAYYYDCNIGYQVIVPDAKSLLS